MKKAVIIGAGPAGLTAAAELLEKTKIKPLIIERSKNIGGLATTIDFKGNKIDIGGHRFFSKSQKVVEWWLKRLPINGRRRYVKINYHNKSAKIDVANYNNYPKTDESMMIRNRKSRIYYDGKFYDYPLKLNLSTFSQLGFSKVFKIGSSYLYCVLHPIRPEKTLEEFFINRFGRELYRTFFKSYTEKVWGKKCSEISPEWGSQRIKGLSFKKAIIASIFRNSRETSIIEKFLYPKFGPGQMWTKVAKEIKQSGGSILVEQTVNRINHKNNKIDSVTIESKNGKRKIIHTDYLFSTMAIKDLVQSLEPKPPNTERNVANGLEYRDFITVGLLLKKLSNKNGSKIDDNWIYIHDPNVKVGRIQFFNNWSPAMVKNTRNCWIGMEYFCNEGDDFWKLKDKEIIKNALSELEVLDLANNKDYIDGTVIRALKAYPSYTGMYKDFAKLRRYLDGFENLYCIGRNGMHKYNNQDHSMLTAMEAVENIIKRKADKSNIWDVNTDEEYHEKA